MNFNKWIDTLLSEKGIQLDQPITVQGPSGPNYMEVSHVVNAIKGASAPEREAIKVMIVKIDFLNGDVLDYLKHLAKAIAI